MQGGTLGVKSLTRSTGESEKPDKSGLVLDLSDYATNQELDAVFGKSRRFRRNHKMKKMRLE